MCVNDKDFELEELRQCHQLVRENHKRSDQIEFGAIGALFALFAYIFSLSDTSTAGALFVLGALFALAVSLRIWALEKYLGSIQSTAQGIQKNNNVGSVVDAVRDASSNPFVRFNRFVIWGLLIFACVAGRWSVSDERPVWWSSPKSTAIGSGNMISNGKND